MAKTYDHAVIYNGVFYPAGAQIEDKEENAPKKAGVSNDAKPVRKSKSRAAE